MSLVFGSFSLAETSGTEWLETRRLPKRAASTTLHVAENHGTLRPMKAMFAEPEIVTRKGKPVSVILSIKHYEQLLERLEDAGDIAYLKKVRRKPMQYRSLDDYLAERPHKRRV
jgi:PHD/YefM family antitoxin component YafN of YafNO toxin-antitoxin module